MKILHVPFCFHPDSVGGTEIYVRNLATAQKRQGAAVVIAATGPCDQEYAVEGLDVYRFQTGGAMSLRQL